MISARGRLAPIAPAILMQGGNVTFLSSLMEIFCLACSASFLSCTVTQSEIRGVATMLLNVVNCTIVQLRSLHRRW